MQAPQICVSVIPLVKHLPSSLRSPTTITEGWMLLTGLAAKMIITGAQTLAASVFTYLSWVSNNVYKLKTMTLNP